MKSKVLVVILASILVCAWAGVGVAGQITYSMRSADKGFATKPDPAPPSSTTMAFDGLIGRPLGAAAFAVGLALLVVEAPLTFASDTTSEAAWGLVGRPAGWTFVRPLGRGAPEYEEKGVFQP
jgi:hypothetical protein